MKATVVATVLLGLLVSGGPAVGLSCDESAPYDLAGAIADSDAALVGQVVSIIGRTEYDEATLLLIVRPTEVFKGSVPPRLIVIRHQTVWGPYYETGDELAVVITDGRIHDGRNSLCGPFYSADEMRAAGGPPIAPPADHWLDAITSLLTMLRLALG